MDRIATICSKGSFLAQILAEPKDFMDRDAIHGVYAGHPLAAGNKRSRWRAKARGRRRGRLHVGGGGGVGEHGSGCGGEQEVRVSL